MTDPAVAERIRKMEDAGIIIGYGARVNPQKIGLPITAIIRIVEIKMPLPQAANLIASFPEVSEYALPYIDWSKLSEYGIIS